MATATAKKAAASAKTSSSTAVATRKAGALVDVKAIQEKLKQQAAAINDKVAPASGITIQVTQSKQFKFPDGTTADSFQGVIVDFVSANLFYEGAYDKDNIQPPACFAIGESPLTLVPSDNSPVRQSDACKGCPMNDFGSAGKGKACKNTRVLAVLPPDADADTPIWLLKVSPTALKRYDSYVRSVASAFGMPPVAVVTTFGFDENSDYASLTFSNPEPNENLGVCYERQEEAKKLLFTEPDVSQYQAEQQAGKGSKPAAKKAAVRR
jgi:hypothetical protein